MLPKSFIFSLENTVFSSEACHKTGLISAQETARDVDPRWKDAKRFLNEYNISVEKVNRQYAKLPSRHSVFLYFKHLVEFNASKSRIDGVTSIYDAYMKGFYRNLQPDEGCKTFLGYLKKKNIRIACVSNDLAQQMAMKIKALGIGDLLDLTMSSEEAGADMPEPNVVFNAMKGLGTGNADTWMMGADPNTDILLSKAYGLKTIYYSRKSTGMTDKKADFVVSNWLEISDILKRG